LKYLSLRCINIGTYRCSRARTRQPNYRRRDRIWNLDPGWSRSRTKIDSNFR